MLANHNNVFKDLRLSVAGIVFLGTPHQGSDAAGYGELLAQATGRDITLLRSLTRNSQILHEIAQDFETSYSNVDLVCFYEKKHGLLGFKVRIACIHFSLFINLETYILQFVDYKSASLIGKRSMYLTTDHSGLNKFHGLEDENFQLVLPEIQRMVQAAQIAIESKPQGMFPSIPLHFSVFSAQIYLYSFCHGSQYKFISRKFQPQRCSCIE